MSIDAYSCLMWSGSLDDPNELAEAKWIRGPLPVELPAAGPSDPGKAERTDRAARAHYFADRVHDRLYGGESDETARRWHMLVDDALPLPSGSTVEAWELLLEEGTGCTLVAHVRLGPEPIGALAALTGAPLPTSRLFASVPAAAPVLDQTRPHVVSHLTWKGAEAPLPAIASDASSALRPWSTVQQWLWFLASGVAPLDGLPDVETPDLLDGTVWLSHDWRALALRDGVAFVATTPSEHGQLFHARARAYVRSLHVDVMLLGRQQVAAVSRLADEVGGLRVDAVSADAVARLEGSLFDLRTGLWWSEVTRRGRQASDVLAAFQQQHRLPGLYTKIVEDLTDAARYVRAKRAAEVEEKRRKEDDRQRRLERLIALVSFVLLPLSIVFSGMALWADPNPILFLVSLGAGVLLVLLIIGVFPDVRRSLRRSSGS